MTVAVIDTGISPERLENPIMLPGINLSGEGDIDDTTDSGKHGTEVARTILSIAPHTRLVPIRLMDRYGCLHEREKVDEAFEWILENRESLGINIVCATFADFSHSTSDAEYRGSRLQQRIATLRELNVLTVAPAGNWYREFRKKLPQGMAWPAIIREVISVGEVEEREDGMRLTERTQRLHSSLGTGCQTTVFSTSGELGNTSGAAAIVVGKIAALLELITLMEVNLALATLLKSQQCLYYINQFFLP
ncbi:S8/S53 family peptidase [Moorena sp. SIO3H5]|uniref:S8/S53 family peptidase n=1 Tax=Moorena sp. SIO3H5 TaxID=2607834 RepID=UPI0025F93F0D|nr:S8/S53 family peptidase [Moorena sp. SIO3H5]